MNDEMKKAEYFRTAEKVSIIDYILKGENR